MDIWILKIEWKNEKEEEVYNTILLTYTYIQIWGKKFRQNDIQQTH